MRSRVLFISGHHDDARLLSRMLDPLPFQLDHAENIQQARARLRWNDYDVILTEATLPDGSWMDILHLARGGSRQLQVIVTDPQADARLWAEVLNLGGYDLLAQPYYEPEVCRILHNACTRPETGAPYMMAV